MNLERQFVATLAFNPELIGTVTVISSDFSDYRAGQIFGTVKGLIQEKKTPDIIMVTELMNFNSTENWLPDVTDIFSYVDIPANLDLMQECIKQESRIRDLKSAGTQFLQDIDKPDAVSNLRSILDQIESGASMGIVSGKQAMAELLEDIDARHRGEKAQGITTGFADIDACTGGLVSGDSIVIAARTSVGKTAFMCNLAVNCGVSCGIISGEQTRLAITRRLAAIAGEVNIQRMKTGQLLDDEWGKLTKAAEVITDRFQIFDASRPSINQIEREARAMGYRHGIEVLFVDYLQLIHNSNYPNDRRLQIADISARLKAIARDLQIAVVTLAQLNRGAVDKTPRISDLKESGAIEEDADQIILLYQEKDRPNNEITFDVQKNREGVTGPTHVLWIPEKMTFRSLSNEY
jgi:replicative DNA helicase